MSRTFSKNLETVIGWSLLALLVLMPFHAFLSVWFGSVLGHANLIQSWKEVVIVLGVLSAIILCLIQPERLKRIDRPIIYSAIGFFLIGLLATLLRDRLDITILYGIKIDFEFIVAFVVAILAFPRRLYRFVIPIILITSAVVAVIAVALVTILPRDTLVIFGYGMNTIAPFAFVGAAMDLVRTPSTLGGPNQLGSFLILPISILTYLIIKKPRWWHIGAGALYIGALIVTYSRSAWLGALVAVLITGVLCIKYMQIRVKRSTFLVAGLSFILISAIALVVSYNRLDYVFLHAKVDADVTQNSTTQHSMALNLGIETILKHPFGLGLGSAGPASFHGQNGLIPENYYLQLAIETGLIGLLAFITFCYFVARALWRARDSIPLSLPLLSALVGISVVNFFLHGWADSSTAIIFWVTAGITIAGATDV